MKKKYCKYCRIEVKDNKCSLCGKEVFTSNIQGKVIFMDYTKSIVAEKMEISENGEYAIKTR